MKNSTCYHCGAKCKSTTITSNEKLFCCTGCKTIYEIFTEHNLSSYYDFETAPGATPKEIASKFDFLSNTKIVEKLVSFSDTDTEVVNLYIPHIHCSSCIWVLENVHKLEPKISSSLVNFGKKTVRITYKKDAFSLKKVVELLSKIGYEPYISLNDYTNTEKKVNRKLYYQLGIAGFAFGNVMFLSFPEYFEVEEFWLEKYKYLFRTLMLVFSIPVVFYAAKDYFSSAIKGLKSGLLTIDVPLALGISVLFIRSCVDVIFNFGAGFFDSLTGLVFFLLLGKFFQQKTYSYLSFERDYTSYFPIAVTKINPKNNTEISIPIYHIKVGDTLLIRNEEIIPVDGTLLSNSAEIDYSFVTGESKIIVKKEGDTIYAGGKQTNGIVEMIATKKLKQSYLTQLWSAAVFTKTQPSNFTSFTNKISRNFTHAVVTIALLAAAYWSFIDGTKALQVFTAVLIIACPCALALAAPFTYGNLLRIFGAHKFYVKEASVLEKLAHINTLIFDKTGTLTATKKNRVIYQGEALNPSEKSLLKSTLRGSNHPLSRSLYTILEENNIVPLERFEEQVGKGLSAHYKNNSIKVGSALFVGTTEEDPQNTNVYVSTNNNYKGKYTFYNSYRKGVSKLFNRLKEQYDLVILSGDNASEKSNLKKLLPTKTKLIFKQTPIDKLEYVKHHQQEGASIAMIGDGLNDAGALAQSDVGIAIAENINVFSPACDAILDASKLQHLHLFLKSSKQALTIIKWSLILSFTYNFIGLYFAVTGNLAPIIAAILMPLSSISVVVYTTIATNLLGRTLSKNKSA